MNTEIVTKTPRTHKAYIHKGAMAYGLDYDTSDEYIQYMSSGLYESIRFVQVDDLKLMETTLTDKGVEYFSNQCLDHFQETMFTIESIEAMGHKVQYNLNNFIPKGKYKIWYAKSSWGGQFKGYDFLKELDMLPNLKKLDETHALLGGIDVPDDLEGIFSLMNMWACGEPSNHFLKSKGVSHTSMSVGDIVEVDGVFHMVDDFGFKTLNS